MKGEIGETVYGMKGAMGEQGDRGEPGPPSNSEYKKTTTTTPVRGPKGLRGHPGDRGSKGELGAKGPMVSNIALFIKLSRLISAYLISRGIAINNYYLQTECKIRRKIFKSFFLSK